MATTKCKIKAGSVKFDGHKTSFMVSFAGRPEERYEVVGNDTEKIYAELEKAASSIDVQQPGGVAPTLKEGVLFTPKTEKDAAITAKAV